MTYHTRTPDSVRQYSHVLYGYSTFSIQYSAAPFPSESVSMTPKDRLGTVVGKTLRVRLTSILRSGAQGVVYSAVDDRDLTDKVRYAVKCLSKVSSKGELQLEDRMNEIRLHEKASSHPNVVSILEVFDDGHSNCIFIIFDYFSEGDLYVYINRGLYVGNEGLVKKIFLQIIDAVLHCHSLGIFHGGLKPDDILVTDDGQTAKLAGFSLATSDKSSKEFRRGSDSYMSPGNLQHNSSASSR